MCASTSPDPRPFKSLAKTFDATRAACARVASFHTQSRTRLRVSSERIVLEFPLTSRHLTWWREARARRLQD